jgi:P-type conjugative transfer ATPase TrbB
MGVELPEADGERIIRLVAAHVGAEVHRGQPLLSAELPETANASRASCRRPAPGPAFALRKRAIGVIPLERYVIDGMMTSAQAGFLVRAVRERQNVLIAGATSSGKTTLANALLAEIAATGDRVLVLEDTVELQCAARDHVPLRTRAGVVSMTELVRSSMRLRPDRVVVGEVRGAEALDLIKVWGTGHPGGIATIHAGSALGALLRLEQLILEVAVNPPRALIAEAVNVVIHIAGRGRKRRIESIARVVGFDGVGYQLADALETPFPELPPLPDAAPAAATSPSPDSPWRTAMTQMHVPAFRVSVNPALPNLARLRSLARPAGQGLLLAALLLFLAGTAQAAGSSMPWEGPLQSILESIQGPVARIVAVIIIIATGLALAFGDTSGGFRKLIQIVFGLSIAFAASSFFLSFFSFSGGAVV